jgi:hypothetical protein
MKEQRRDARIIEENRVVIETNGTRGSEGIETFDAFTDLSLGGVGSRPTGLESGVSYVDHHLKIPQVIRITGGFDGSGVEPGLRRGSSSAR